MNTVAYFEIQAAQPDSLIAFYREVFGWQFTRAEGFPIPYWRIETGGIRAGLLRRPAKTPPPECGTNAYVCSIEISDIDATTQAILSLGGTVGATEVRRARRMLACLFHRPGREHVRGVPARLHGQVRIAPFKTGPQSRAARPVRQDRRLAWRRRRPGARGR